MMQLKSFDQCAADFPALNRTVDGQSLVFLDGPGGVQVPEYVIEAISNYYRTSNANTHGYFITTRETDQVLDQARQDMADFLGATSSDTISFGQNMTTLNFSLSKALARHLPAGCEILVTQLDHEANRGPWLRMRDEGFLVREVKLLDDGTLDYDDFQEKIGPQTGLVAVGYASNALGTINDIGLVRQWCRESGALMVVDAVHYAPHFSIDVQSLDCDFLLCSAYKFYGPHVGILYSRPGLLDQLDPDRLITQEQQAPYFIETGTLNHAALAGVSAAVDYMAQFGSGPTKKTKLRHALGMLQEYEFMRVKQLQEGLDTVEGLNIIGPPLDPEWHTPTLAFTLEGYTPSQVCAYLGEHQICAWDGHFYALRAIEVMGLLDRGRVTRMGISMYTSDADIERTVEAVEALVKQASHSNLPTTS